VSSSDRQRPTSFSILVVCTGNICRSPIAEQLLRARFAASGLDVTVSSAGTGALVGASMTPEAAQLSMNYGGVPSSHRARELTETLVANADLVLTATRDHRQAVATLHPRASRHTYTLAQFARLVSQLSPTEPGVASRNPFESSPSDAGATALADSGPLHRRLTALVDQVAESRGFAPPPAHAEAEDIPDPYRQSQEVYDRVGALLDSSVETIAAFLATATAER
jgi:protein-tyrosine phosphatase